MLNDLFSGHSSAIRKNVAHLNSKGLKTKNATITKAMIKNIAVMPLVKPLNAFV